MKPSERMKIRRQEMPMRDAGPRSTCFQEVNLGLTEHLAVLEAKRCLDCRTPRCIDGCPVQVDIPGFILCMAQGDFAGAGELMLRDNALPGITGRVCPQEKQCEEKCLRGTKDCAQTMAIGYLERFIADWMREHRPGQAMTLAAPTGLKVAIVGSGPAGLTAAGELARLGHHPTIFEALHQPGGVLVYGIPEFRLPKDVVRAEVSALQKLGVEIITNVVVGQTITIDELMKDEGFSAVFIANGAGLPVFMGIPGENIKGVYSANEYLTRVNLMRAYDPSADTPVLRAKKVVVIGGGNTAMDAVRTARRLGASRAVLVYRRSRAELPARAEEVKHAEEEGIEMQLLTLPVAILGTPENWVRGLRCLRMQLGEPDASGRARPIPIPGSEYEIDCEVVIEAIGTRANPLLTQTTPDLKVNSRGYIDLDAEGMTSKPGVFAGGDIVRGAATVILAMGDGKQSARAIDRYLRRKHGLPLPPLPNGQGRAGEGTEGGTL
jgi:glutamate synthase (NADPH/NADH) small chain